MKQVYFIRRSNGTGPIKIGATGDMPTRLYALTQEVGEPLCILAFVAGTHDDENRIQRGFNHLRVEGEWFKPDAELLEFISKVITRQGSLPPVPYDERTKQMAQMVRRMVSMRVDEGLSCLAIAKKFGCSSTCVIGYLSSAGVDTKKLARPSTIKKATRAAELYKQGVSTGEIAKRLHTHQPSIYRFLKIAGVSPDRRTA